MATSMASAMEAVSVLALTFNKCQHSDKKSLMTAVPNRLGIATDLFEQYHGTFDPKSCKITIKCKTDLSSKESFDIDGRLTVGDVIEKFGMKCIEFCCCKEENELNTLTSIVKIAAETATKKTINAFQVLMAGGRIYPTLKRSRYKNIIPIILILKKCRCIEKI